LEKTFTNYQPISIFSIKQYKYFEVKLILNLFFETNKPGKKPMPTVAMRVFINCFVSQSVASNALTSVLFPTKGKAISLKTS